MEDTVSSLQGWYPGLGRKGIALWVESKKPHGQRDLIHDSWTGQYLDVFVNLAIQFYLCRLEVHNSKTM